MTLPTLTSVEICAGAGGQALGLELAGFTHLAAVENDPAACETLRINRPKWNVVEEDLHGFSGTPFRGADLLAGGVPCPPFSIAGKRLGTDDERDLFPVAVRLAGEIEPDAVLLENVPGFGTAKFADYRSRLKNQLEDLGYQVDWQILNACNYGVPQLRPRFLLVALRPAIFARFQWPEPVGSPPTVGDVLVEQMASAGWPGALKWAQAAKGIGPTLVGGSKKHGGPDLGPTRAKQAWLKLGVNAKVLANEPPGPDFPVDEHPKLTVRMAATVQGFPQDWQFSGRKTAAYRQVGNAFPPPVAQAVGAAIRSAILRETRPVDAAQREFGITAG